MEKIISIERREQVKRSCRKADSKFCKLNKVIHRLFVLFAIVSVFIASSVNDQSEHFFKLVFIFFSIFMLSVFIAWYFDFPQRSRKVMAIILYNTIVRTMNFFEELKYKNKVKHIIKDARYSGTSWKEIYEYLSVE